MHSNDIEKTIADLNEFLKYKHPSSVLQFIPGMMIGWTHSEKKPSASDIDLAWDSYFNLLRSRIDTRLSSLSSQPHSNERREKKVLPTPAYVYEEAKLNEVIALLGNMLPDDAIDFMVEVTVNWCFSIPISFLHLLPDPPHNQSDEAVANAVYEWLVGYYDLWH